MNTFAKKAVAIALTVLAGTSMALPLDDISGVATTWKLKGITTELETYTKPSQVGFAGGFGAGALKETTWGVGEITGIDDVNFCLLTSSDVVRHRLVGEIVEAYGRYDARRQEAVPRVRRG